VLKQHVAQRRRDRHVAAPLAALGGDLALYVIPAAADLDDAVSEVDVLPAQRDQLAAAQPCVDRGREERPILTGQRREQRLGDAGRRDELGLATHGGHLETARRVGLDIAPCERSPIDGLERQQRGLHGRRRVPGGHELVDEPLQLHALDLTDPALAEPGSYAQPQVLLVGADRAWLVRVAAAVADLAGARPVKPRLRRLGDRGSVVGGRAQLPRSDGRAGVLTPRAGRGKGWERLADPLVLRGAPHLAR
jgi:hypothetical protein